MSTKRAPLTTMPIDDDTPAAEALAEAGMATALALAAAITNGSPTDAREAHRSLDECHDEDVALAYAFALSELDAAVTEWMDARGTPGSAHARRTVVGKTAAARILGTRLTQAGQPR